MLLERVLGFGRWVAVALALLASSLLFSAMHHIPPYGDPLHLGVFLFRVLAGCFFGLVYWSRGFAVASTPRPLRPLRPAASLKRKVRAEI